MAIAVLFRPASMNAEQYAEIHRRLHAAGLGENPARLQHICFGDSGRLCVLDVWESEESFHSFGQHLLPILASIGIDPGQPEIHPVHQMGADLPAAAAVPA